MAIDIDSSLSNSDCNHKTFVASAQNLRIVVVKKMSCH